MPDDIANYNYTPLRKVDWHIVTSILQFLYKNSYQRKTVLSMNVGLQYSRFMRYVRWLQFVKWIDFVKKDGANVLVLTKEGLEVCEKLKHANKNNLN